MVCNALTQRNTYKKLALSLFLFSLPITSAAAAVTTFQTEQWQKDINNQILQQRASQKQGTNITSESIMPQARMKAITDKIKNLASNDEAFKHHQIQRYCQTELSTICHGLNANDPSLNLCLINNESVLSKQCKTVALQNELGEYIKNDMYYHDILIPKNSRFYYVKGDKSIGIKLSKQTSIQGLTVKDEISWYAGGNIKSYTPALNPVQFNQIILAPKAKIIFFPNGSVKEGVLFDSFSTQTHNFAAGQVIYRETPRSLWKLK